MPFRFKHAQMCCSFVVFIVCKQSNHILPPCIQFGVRSRAGVSDASLSGSVEEHVSSRLTGATQP